MCTKNTYKCVCVCLCVLGCDVRCCLLWAWVQRFESHSLRELLPAQIPKARHTVDAQRLFGEWKDRFKFSSDSGEQVHPPQVRKAFSKPKSSKPGVVRHGS